MNFNQFLRYFKSTSAVELIKFLAHTFYYIFENIIDARRILKAKTLNKHKQVWTSVNNIASISIDFDTNSLSKAKANYLFENKFMEILKNKFHA